jgi:Ca-activated chloride channel family protein
LNANAIAPHHVRLVVNLAAGDRIVQTVRTSGIAFAETVDVNVVQVTVTVMDDDGKYVKGLPRSAFHLAEDGRAQAVSHFYSDEAPLELVVAVDTSGSMQEAMAKMKQAVAGFLAAVPARHSVTLLGFNDAAFALAPKTADAAARMRAVDQLSAWGLTALYDTIIRGVDTLGAQPGRKALLVFTDGDDRGSHVTVDEAERWLQSSDLVLYMIGQGQGVTHDPLKKLMTRLARPTGGRAISTHSIDALRESFTEVLDELSNQYVLGYEPTNAIRDGAWREINVTVDGHQRVRARLGYRAASRK